MFTFMKSSHWRASVMEKENHIYCLVIERKMLCLKSVGRRSDLDCGPRWCPEASRCGRSSSPKLPGTQRKRSGSGDAQWLKQGRRRETHWQNGMELPSLPLRVNASVMEGPGSNWETLIPIYPNSFLFVLPGHNDKQTQLWTSLSMWLIFIYTDNACDRLQIMWMFSWRGTRSRREDWRRISGMDWEIRIEQLA